MIELEADYRRETASGSGCVLCYTVEARINYPRPEKIGDYLLDNRWSRVHFKRDSFGVPVGSEWFNRNAAENGMLGYSAAQALRWWLHAIADSINRGTCLETRIVKHELTYSHKIVAVSAHDMIGAEDRSNCMPDWGEKKVKAENTRPDKSVCVA